MSSETRKFRRKGAAKSKKKAEKEMARKVALFGNIPTKCLTCAAPFDKMDKEQVTTWRVVVRDKEEKVRLYCPTCWAKAAEILENFTKEKEKNEQS